MDRLQLPFGILSPQNNETKWGRKKTSCVKGASQLHDPLVRPPGNVRDHFNPILSPFHTEQCNTEGKEQLCPGGGGGYKGAKQLPSGLRYEPDSIGLHVVLTKQP